MRVEMSTLELEIQTLEVIYLQKVTHNLSNEYYVYYKKFQDRTSEYNKSCFPIQDTDDVEVRT